MSGELKLHPFKTIVLVGNSAYFLLAAADLIEEHKPDVEVVGMCRPDQTIEKLARGKPDLVIMLTGLNNPLVTELLENRDFTDHYTQKSTQQVYTVFKRTSDVWPEQYARPQYIEIPPEEPQTKSIPKALVHKSQASRKRASQPEVAPYYSRLPLMLKFASLPADTPRWRIELAAMNRSCPAKIAGRYGSYKKPIGYDIVGDTLVGRGWESDSPIDLDLEWYGGPEDGISRHHALLRPTTDHLAIIDLGSVYGTYLNGALLAEGIEYPLGHDDWLTLGQLFLKVNVIGDRDIIPADPPASPPEPAPDPIPNRPRGKGSKAAGAAAQIPEDPADLDLRGRPFPGSKTE